MIAIDWTSAPEWANYAAMDLDGRWFFHEFEPKFDKIEWVQPGEIKRLESAMAENTLAKRPSSPAELNTMDCQGGQ